MKNLLHFNVRGCGFALFLCAQSAFAGPAISSVQIAVENGVPHFGIQYSYEPTQVTWALTAAVITSSLPATRPLFVRTIDRSSDASTSEWQDSGLATGISQQDVFTFHLDRKSALRTIKAFPHVSLQFSADQKKVEAVLDLQVLCASSPGNFLDLTSMKTGCSPDRAALDALPEQTGGLCNQDLHKRYCTSTFEAVRDAIGKQRQCVFKCR